MNEAEEDEWEYEYDESEVEHFYITLDLSGAAPDKLNTSSRSQPNRPPQQAENAQQNGEQSMTDRPDPNTADLDGIQLLDLHTPNPLIHYQGQVLSCQWASTIGTDMLFAEPPSDREWPSEPLRSLPSFDLLGISSAKLVATRSQLRTRPRTRQRRPRTPKEGNTRVLDHVAFVNDDSAADRPAIVRPVNDKSVADQHAIARPVNDSSAVDEQTIVRLTPDPQKSRINQANFLNRLNSIKANKGEPDRASGKASRSTRRAVALNRPEELDSDYGEGGTVSGGLMNSHVFDEASTQPMEDADSRVSDGPEDGPEDEYGVTTNDPIAESSQKNAGGTPQGDLDIVMGEGGA
ncbi:hypothetical protein K432DRAFT_236216 [Lepidopterella palustris CBS 459.81]|uniref:Transcription factor TFIIIC triple barrel domain-containing protein n=1 Tax=Lepidopterella palustris CBS 459.81 TaxID=1314670 RepID=A0A8E2EDJ9_9PEZI|nr:hypothetical protein K432DRAFT_236216 [Lepidopterella palustris CBS 459.81]